MKDKFTNLHLLITVLSIIVLITMLTHSSEVLNGIRLFLYLNPQMNKLVFEEGFDATQVDGAVITSCLHDGGGCPAKVKYVNDETGQVEERPLVSDRTIYDVVPSVNSDRNQPTNSQTLPIDIVAYVIFFIILIAIIIVLIFLVKHYRKTSQTLA